MDDLPHRFRSHTPSSEAGLLPWRFACWGSMLDLRVDLPARQQAHPNRLRWRQSTPLLLYIRGIIVHQGHGHAQQRRTDRPAEDIPEEVKHLAETHAGG